MEEAREQQHSASVPQHRRFPEPSCRTLRGLGRGSGPKPMFEIGFASVAPAVGRDLGHSFFSFFGLAFVAQSRTFEAK